MGDDRRRVMYDGFNSDTLGHSDAWVKVTNEFVERAFAGEPRIAKCPCSKCRNLIRLKKYDVSIHLCKYGFMPNYLVWREHGEVDAPADESNVDEDEDRKNDMLDDIRHGYPALENDQASTKEAQEFYKLLEASDVKVHEGTDVTVHQAVKRLMTMKSKHNFSNNCYNDIVKLIIDLIGDGVVERRNYSRQSSFSAATSRPRQASARDEELLELQRQMQQQIQQMQLMQSQQMMHAMLLQQAYGSAAFQSGMPPFPVSPVVSQPMLSSQPKDPSPSRVDASKGSGTKQMMGSTRGGQVMSWGTPQPGTFWLSPQMPWGYPSIGQSPMPWGLPPWSTQAPPSLGARSGSQQTPPPKGNINNVDQLLNPSDPPTK